MTKPTLYLFVGYPGSGKTTVAGIIEKSTGATHIWADHIRHDLFQQPDHSPAENEALYKQLNQQTDALLDAGKSVLFDTNFNYRKDRDYLRSIAAKHGAHTAVIWLTTPRTVAQERATHETHRVRNRYHETMSLATFQRLCDHLEAPTDDEAPIKVDGTKVDAEALSKQLGQQS